MRVLWCLVLALAAPAWAAKKVVLVHGPAKVTKVLNKALASKYNPDPLDPSLGPTPTAQEVRKVTAPPGAIAVVQAQLAGKTVTLQILSGHDGTPLDTLTFKLPKKFKALPKATSKALFNALAQGQAPAPEATPPPAEPAKEPEPAPPVVAAAATVAAVPPPSTPPPPPATPVEPPAEVISSTTSSEAAASPLPAVVTGVGFKGFARSFTWANASESLQSYSLPFASAVTFDASWFPGAHFTSGAMAHFGLFLNGDVAVGLSSSKDDSRYGTRADRFRFGGRIRIPLGKSALLEVLGGYSTQTFSIANNSANTGASRPAIPSVTYNGPRGALGAKFVLTGTLTAELSAGFMYVYGKGEIASYRYFPDTTGLAADAAAGLSVEVVSNLRVRVGFDWTGYFLTTHADPMAATTATGASDHYLGGTLSILWVM